MNTDNILLVWGDIPFIQKNTVQSLLEYYSDTKSKFTFITKKVDLAYTLVARNQNNSILYLLSKPGLWLQHITTNEPNNKQLEVAITALRCAFSDDIKEYEGQQFQADAIG